MLVARARFSAIEREINKLEMNNNELEEQIKAFLKEK